MGEQLHWHLLGSLAANGRHGWQQQEETCHPTSSNAGLSAVSSRQGHKVSKPNRVLLVPSRATLHKPSSARAPNWRPSIIYSAFGGQFLFKSPQLSSSVISSLVTPNSRSSLWLTDSEATQSDGLPSGSPSSGLHSALLSSRSEGAVLV